MTRLSRHPWRQSNKNKYQFRNIHVEFSLSHTKKLYSNDDIQLSWRAFWFTNYDNVWKCISLSHSVERQHNRTHSLPVNAETANPIYLLGLQRFWDCYNYYYNSNNTDTFAVSTWAPWQSRQLLTSFSSLLTFYLQPQVYGRQVRKVRPLELEQHQKLCKDP